MYDFLLHHHVYRDVSFVFMSSALTTSVVLLLPGAILGIATLVMLAVGTVINYLCLLATSSFSATAIICAYKCQTITRSAAVAYTVLQFIPLADVISYGFIIRALKNGEKKHPRSPS